MATDLEYPQPEFRDRFRQVVTAFTDVHPAASVTVNVFDLLIAPSLQRRRDAFFVKLGEDLAALAAEVDDLENRLAEREEAFAT